MSVATESLVDCLVCYWRIRAALSVARSNTDIDRSILLKYRNYPEISSTSHYLSSEPLSVALSQLELYERDRLAVDCFLMIIARFEMFLSQTLRRCGNMTEGTLGHLQEAAQREYSIARNCAEVLLADEIRERRNCVIHSHEKATARYITKAIAASRLCPTVVAIPTVGQLVRPDEAYLTHSVDVLMRYYALFP